MLRRLACSRLILLAAALPLGCAGRSYSYLGEGGAPGDAGRAPDLQTDVPDAGPPAGPCPVTFRFKPDPGAQNLRVAGEWQGFDLRTAPTLTGPDGDGNYSAKVDLSPGLWAYKLVFDRNGGTEWILDPGQGRRKYVSNVENSAIKVA